MSKLSVTRIKERTRVLGPGVRVAIWFHGCHRNCPGCIAKEMNASTACDQWMPEDLVRRVLGVRGVEGVTISGGEPFDQEPVALRTFLTGVREAGLSVMAYTGYRIEELRTKSELDVVLGLVDVLVDGPYVEVEDHGELWRGSANQRMHFLTSRYRDIAEAVVHAKGRELELSFQEGLSFTFSGIPPRGFRDKLNKEFSKKDLEVHFK